MYAASWSFHEDLQRERDLKMSARNRQNVVKRQPQSNPGMHLPREAPWVVRLTRALTGTLTTNKQTPRQTLHQI